MLIRHVAQVCYEANRAYCNAMGDFSHRPFDIAYDWQIEAVIRGIQFTLGRPRDESPEVSHEAWRDHLLRAGWRHGPVKDLGKKEHPNLVPYDDLPAQEKVKDTIFMAIVSALRDMIEDGPESQYHDETSE